MDPTKDILQKKWAELKSQGEEHREKITDDEVARLSGKTAELAGLLQEGYRYGRVEAGMEIRNWLRHVGKARAAA